MTEENKKEVEVNIDYGNLSGRKSMDETEVIAGKGLDVGTANFVSARQDKDGNLTIKTQRNAFLDIESDDFTRNMLTRLNVQYVVLSNKMIVIGDPAFELANIFNRETRRPMKDGLISPKEADALPIMKLLIENILGPPSVPKETCYFSVPADPIDAEMNVIYHKGIFEGLLRKIGYNPKAMLEGHAVIFSELAEEDFTGIGISCGGGMFNVCVAYKAIPALAFSTTRAGDWIDKNVAAVLGITTSRSAAIKEKGVDIRSPRNREEEAIVIYYRNLINYTLENIKRRFEDSKGMPTFPEAIEIVTSGGTSMVGGFVEIFQDEFEKVKFPVDVKNIRRSEDPLSAVAKGALVASLTE